MAVDDESQTAEQRIDNAMQAASETARSWKHRCYNILSALDLDYGDADELLPDEVDALEAERAKVRRLRDSLKDFIPQETTYKDAPRVVKARKVLDETR